jgi:MATE family multidrug resistance protein
MRIDECNLHVPLVSATDDDSTHNSTLGTQQCDLKALSSPSSSLSSASSPSLTSSPVSWQYELSQIFSIALPNALQLFAAIGMSLTDMAVLGHYDTTALAAAGFALLWMNISMELVYRGLAGATNVLCAQAFGAKNYKLVGDWCQLAMVVTTLFLIPLVSR